MLRATIDFNCSISATVLLVQSVIRDLTGIQECELTQYQPQKYEYYIFKSMIQDKFKIHIHKINNNLCRITITDNSGLGFARLTYEKLVSDLESLKVALSNK